MEIQDNIERTVTIDAPRNVVWQLVAQPGWWINTAGDELVEAARAGRPAHRTEERDGRVVVHDDKLGEFPLIVESREEPNRVAYRWAPWDAENVTETGSLVEFTLTGPDSGPTQVTVLESGMTQLGLDPEEAKSAYDDHMKGWDMEMDALVRAAEAGVDRA